MVAEEMVAEACEKGFSTYPQIVPSGAHSGCKPKGGLDSWAVWPKPPRGRWQWGLFVGGRLWGSWSLHRLFLTLSPHSTRHTLVHAQPCHFQSVFFRWYHTALGIRGKESLCAYPGRYRTLSEVHLPPTVSTQTSSKFSVPTTPPGCQDSWILAGCSWCLSSIQFCQQSTGLDSKGRDDQLLKSSLRKPRRVLGFSRSMQNSWPGKFKASSEARRRSICH